MYGDFPAIRTPAIGDSAAALDLSTGAKKSGTSVYGAAVPYQSPIHAPFVPGFMPVGKLYVQTTNAVCAV